MNVWRDAHAELATVVFVRQRRGFGLTRCIHIGHRFAHDLPNPLQGDFRRARQPCPRTALALPRNAFAQNVPPRKSATTQIRHRGDNELAVAILQNRVEIGAGGRSRTLDLRITNALLYQLSYTGAGARRTRHRNVCVPRSSSASIQL